MEVMAGYLEEPGGRAFIVPSITPALQGLVVRVATARVLGAVAALLIRPSVAPAVAGRVMLMTDCPEVLPVLLLRGALAVTQAVRQGAMLVAPATALIVLLLEAAVVAAALYQPILVQVVEVAGVAEI